MPITRTAPACALPGLMSSPGLAAWKVAVAIARMAVPATSPVEASTPLGTSQAITGSPEAATAAIASPTGPRGSPVKPVPSSASTTTAAPRRPSGVNGSGGAPVSRSTWTRASPLSSSGGVAASTRTRCHAARRRRAAA